MQTDSRAIEYTPLGEGPGPFNIDRMRHFNSTSLPTELQSVGDRIERTNNMNDIEKLNGIQVLRQGASRHRSDLAPFLFGGTP